MKRGFLVGGFCCTILIVSGLAHADEHEMTPSTRPPELVFEDPGIIQVVQGVECGRFAGDSFLGNIENLAEGFVENFPCCAFDAGVYIYDVPWTPFASDEGMIKKAETWSFPGWANRATVILNGWSLTYVDTDHHVYALGATLMPEQSGDTLRWTGAATLGDKGMDDEISACLFYTALAWNSAEIDAVATAVEPALENTAPMGRDDWERFGNGGAELWYEVGDPAVNMSESVAVLPRGFVLASEFRPDDDDHVFQIGHAVSQVTTVNLTAPAAWTAAGLIRDNKDSTTFVSSPVTILRGGGVGVIDEEFEIAERRPKCPFWEWGGCIGPASGENPGPVHNEAQRETFRVQSDEGYLIPMLTGFDLSFATDDQHLRWAMAAIDDMTFDPESGVLEYRVSTALRDKNGKPGYRVQHDVDVLVLHRGRSGGGFDHLGTVDVGGND